MKDMTPCHWSNFPLLLQLTFLTLLPLSLSTSPFLVISLAKVSNIYNNARCPKEIVHIGGRPYSMSSFCADKSLVHKVPPEKIFH